MRPVKEILEDALDLIEQWGWHQGSYVGPDNSLCSLGAIRAASWDNTCCGNSSNSLERVDEVNAAAKQLITIINPQALPYAFEVLVGFNDNPETTLEDVKLLFKKAIYEADTRVQGSSLKR